MDKAYDLGLAPTPNAPWPNLKTIFDLDKLHRLHPHWIIEGRREVDGGGVRFDIRDHATDKHFHHTAHLSFEDHPEMPGLTLRLDGGPFTSLRLFLKAGRFTVATRQPTAEVEADLLLWLRGLREYLRLYLTRSPHALIFRLLMNRVILPMTPSQRKICLMLFRFTLLEILVIVMIGVGWMLFMR